MYENIFSIGLIVTALVMFTLFLIGQRKISHLRRSLSDQIQLIDTIKNDVRALFTGAVGEDSRLHRLEIRTRRIIQRQEQMENSKHTERPYEQAIRMVHQGSKVEDLMAVCHLSKGEADLIMMVHGTDRSGVDASGQYH